MILILFDIDGTLVNARGGGSRAFVDALGLVCGHAVDAVGVPFGGRTDAGIAVELLARHGIERDAALGLLETVWTHYLPRLADSLTRERPSLYPGVWEVLERLARRDDVVLGLLTGNHEPAAWLKLEAVGIDGYFRLGAFGGDAVERHALPEVALRAARRLGHRRLDVERAVVVGDTPHDIACARHAGMRALAVATGRHSVDALRDHAPDVLMADLSDTDAVVRAIVDG